MAVHLMRNFQMSLTLYLVRSSLPHPSPRAKEIAQIGQFVYNSQSVQFHENGIIRYAQTVAELDVGFLEQVRKEVCLGLDAFDVVENAGSTMLGKQVRNPRIQDGTSH
jgi:hypothetical protein